MFKSKKHFLTWLQAAGVRAIKTMAETAIGLIGTNAIGITDVNWLGVLSACALSGVVALLLAIKGLPEVSIEEAEVDD